jgi:hypothetical protein
MIRLVRRDFRACPCIDRALEARASLPQQTAWLAQDCSGANRRRARLRSHRVSARSKCCRKFEPSRGAWSMALRQLGQSMRKIGPGSAKLREFSAWMWDGADCQLRRPPYRRGKERASALEAISPRARASITTLVSRLSPKKTGTSRI